MDYLDQSYAANLCSYYFQTQFLQIPTPYHYKYPLRICHKQESCRYCQESNISSNIYKVGEIRGKTKMLYSRKECDTIQKWNIIKWIWCCKEMKGGVLILRKTLGKHGSRTALHRPWVWQKMGVDWFCCCKKCDYCKSHFLGLSTFVIAHLAFVTHQ